MKPALAWVVADAGTDKRVSAAMHRCLNQLTQYHSVTSRRHSISSLISRELDDEVCRVIRAYCVEQRVAVLTGFRLSRVWQRPPEGCMPPASILNKVAAANRCASQWRDLLKSTVREANRRAGMRSSTKTVRFCRTLDSVMQFIDVLQGLKPAHTHDGEGKRVSLRAKSNHAAYCELCWRPTMFSTLRDHRHAEDVQRGVSRRFCSEHSPQKSASIYRRDLAFKDRFEQEINFLREGWSRIRDTIGPIVKLRDASKPTGYEVHLVPVTPDPEDIRRAAYALVHGKLQGTGSQCWILKEEGRSSRQIAEDLMIPDRTVRSALAMFEVKLAQADRIRLGTNFRDLHRL
ncbi:hypothetical protein [Ralstonia pseudosolanacearum]|uniref:hypothetical protein n=1 Tax=Ralstonia pseudosolanacearum TaxID=1310165 RepID=UPI0011B4DB9B|nr:hypothetical protein [Ralstonia pseudosolanacearum]